MPAKKMTVVVPKDPNIIAATPELERRANVSVVYGHKVYHAGTPFEIDAKDFDSLAKRFGAVREDDLIERSVTPLHDEVKDDGQTYFEDDESEEIEKPHHVGAGIYDWEGRRYPNRDSLPDEAQALLPPRR
jgi:hypothetical protein